MWMRRRLNQFVTSAVRTSLRHRCWMKREETGMGLRFSLIRLRSACASLRFMVAARRALMFFIGVDWVSVAGVFRNTHGGLVDLRRKRKR